MQFLEQIHGVLWWKVKTLIMNKTTSYDYYFLINFKQTYFL